MKKLLLSMFTFMVFLIFSGSLEGKYYSQSYSGVGYYNNTYRSGVYSKQYHPKQLKRIYKEIRRNSRRIQKLSYRIQRYQKRLYLGRFRSYSYRKIRSRIFQMRNEISWLIRRNRVLNRIYNG